MMTKYVLFVLIYFLESVVSAFSDYEFRCNVEEICSDGPEVSHILSDVCKPSFCNGNENTICPTSDIVDANLEECRHQLSFFNLSDIKVNDLPDYLQTSYYLVLKCPPDTDSKLTAECESMDNPTESHYVSSVSTYRIYKNKHCARCNNEESYVEWRSVVGLSKNELTGINAGFYDETRLANLIKGKPVFSASPIGYPNYTNICRSGIIGTCNETGAWKAFDENIIRLCGSSKFQVVESGKKPNRLYYRNAYCFVCNNDISIQTCKLPSADSRYTHPMINLLYLEHDVLQNAIDLRDERYTCGNSQIVDPLKVSLLFTIDLQMYTIYTVASG
ncbi:hypothetical protein ACF0H5_012558 [Mactra antiquata]